MLTDLSRLKKKRFEWCVLYRDMVKHYFLYNFLYYKIWKLTVHSTIVQVM